jgi:hypothetical protein
MALQWASLMVLVVLAGAENKTTVYKFDAMISDDNLLTVQPNKSPGQSTGYSICLRAMFWKRDEIILFKSTNISLIVFDGKFVCISINSTKHCFDMIRNSTVSMKWKSFCIMHSFIDFTINTSINGKLANSMKIVVSKNFTENLSNSIEMGGGTLLLKYITDFNIWKRPLLEQEVEEYSSGYNFNTLGENGPDILSWSDANVTYQGYYCTKFVISRALLASQIQVSSEEFPINPFFILNHPLEKTYDKSVHFCKQIRGTLFLPTQPNLQFIRSHYYWDDLNSDFFWVPIVKSSNGNSKWVYDSEVGDILENIPTLNVKGTSEQNCLAFNVSSEEYIPYECSKTQHLLCKTPEEGIIFFAFQNSTVNVELEFNYILINDEGYLLFAGLTGKNTIYFNNTMWLIIDVKSLKAIGYYVEKYLESPVGLHTVMVLDKGKNEYIQFQMKLSNVS